MGYSHIAVNMSNRIKDQRSLGNYTVKFKENPDSDGSEHIVIVEGRKGRKELTIPKEFQRGESAERKWFNNLTPERVDELYEITSI